MRLDRFLERWEWWREVGLLLLALLIPTTAFLAYFQSIFLIRLVYCLQTIVLSTNEGYCSVLWGVIHRAEW